MIFHELFLTIFFVKNEVELNENLAQFFAEELADIYFTSEQKKKSLLKKQAQRKKKKKIIKELSFLLKTLAQELNESYKKRHATTFLVAQEVFQDFMKNVFERKVSQFCKRKKIPLQKCSPLQRSWNNASLAAYLTYEGKQSEVEQWFQDHGGSLRTFYVELKKRYF